MKVFARPKRATSSISNSPNNPLLRGGHRCRVPTRRRDRSRGRTFGVVTRRLCWLSIEPGESIDAKLGQVELRVGDTLMLVADAGFRERWRDRSDFLLVSGSSPCSVTDKSRSLDSRPDYRGHCPAGFPRSAPHSERQPDGRLRRSVGLRILTPGEARGAIDLDVIVLIASAFGVAAAVESSGLAAIVAGGLVDVFAGFGRPRASSSASCSPRWC